MRHAITRLMLGLRADAVSPAKRAAHLNVVEIIPPAKGTTYVPCIPILRKESLGLLDLWSGLSESNRHLNLGKVPYYHYTKAAQPHSFYNMPATAETSLAWPRHAKAKQSASKIASGNLRDARRLHDRRAALPLGEARSLFLVGVHAPELFAVSVENTDEIVVMLAAAILAKGALSSSRALLRPTFCHVDHPCFIRVSMELSQGSKRRASTG